MGRGAARNERGPQAALIEQTRWSTLARSTDAAMRILARLLASAAIAAAMPWVEVRLTCYRDPLSEACVWGKAYLPLSTGISTVVFTPLVFLILWLIERGVRRRRTTTMKEPRV